MGEDANARVSRKYPHRALRLGGRLIITTCRQGSAAPLVDDAIARDREGNRYDAKAILLTPWRKDQHGQHLRQRALVLGWRT